MRMRQRNQIILVLLILFWGSIGRFPDAGYCQRDLAVKDLAVFQYDSKGKRDPFVPLLGKTPAAKKGEGLAYVETVSELRLEGIVWDPSSGSYAFLNGEVLMPGDQVGKVKLLAVYQRKVEIQFGNEVVTLHLQE